MKAQFGTMLINSTLKTKYPTTKEIVLRMQELEPIADNWTDETIYDAIGKWDLKFADDPNWLNEKCVDMKDTLTDEVQIDLNWDDE